MSLFDGTEPAVALADTIDDETELVSTWIKARIAEAVRPDEIGLFVRSEAQIAQARLAVKASGFQSTLLTEKADIAFDSISVGTMHFAKGLEFRCVAVKACDEDILPLQERIEAVTDESDLKEVYDTERHLLYVACTREQDHLLVTGVEPASEFLTDLGHEAWT